MLKMFTNGVDTVIAESEDDAIQVWEEEFDADWADYSKHFKWRELPNGDDYTMRFRNIADRVVRDVPLSSIVTEIDEHGNFSLKATVRAWIAQDGRGFFDATKE